MAITTVLLFSALTAGCSRDPAPVTADVIGLLSGDSEGYARVLGPREIVFPEDHGPHPDYRTEWWYYTGNLIERGRSGGRSGSSGEARRFGFQLTVFRSALDPSPDEPDSAWGSGQAYLAHFALTDVEAGTQHAAERLSRGDAGLAGANSSPLRVWVETWEIAEVFDGGSDGGDVDDGRDGGKSGQAKVRGGGPPGSFGPRVRLNAADGPASIDLVLTPGKSPVFHGDNGFSPKGPEPGNASYYYSLTRQAAEGTIRTADGEFEVQGEAWMDHEWSTSALSQGQAGWDWLSLQLDDGREVMAFQIRETDGGTAPASSGSVIEADGTVRPFGRKDFELTPDGGWTSPRTRGRYPTVWRLELPDQGLDLEVTPLIEDQELDVAIRYWEGAVRVTGLDTFAERPVQGFGYLEMTGYAPSIAGGSRAPGQ